MKAIRKSDGKKVDVSLYTKKQFIETARGEDGGYNIYSAEDLIVDEPVVDFDWDSFRREVAKDIIAGMVGTFSIDTEEGIRRHVRRALTYTNELIRQLKEDKK